MERNETTILARYAADVDRWHADAIAKHELIRHGAVTTDPEALAIFDEAWHAAAKTRLEETV